MTMLHETRCFAKSPELSGFAEVAVNVNVVSPQGLTLPRSLRLDDGVEVGIGGVLVLMLILTPSPIRYLQGELLSPCRCSGSVRCTHHPCLIKWISERGSWACELCYYKYQVIAISTKNPLQVRPEAHRRDEIHRTYHQYDCGSVCGW